MNQEHKPMSEMTPAELQAMIAALRAENQRLGQAKADQGLGMKVSAKGALSVYGLGRFPITLYKGQWTKLLAKAETIAAFIKAHDSELAEKSTEAKAG